jgi:hypothetical protein
VVALRIFLFLSLVVLAACSRQSDVSSPGVFDPSVLLECEIVLGRSEFLTALSIVSNHKNEGDRELLELNSPFPDRLTQTYGAVVDNIAFQLELAPVDSRYESSDNEFDVAYLLTNISAKITLNGEAIALDDNLVSEFVSLTTGSNEFHIIVDYDLEVTAEDECSNGEPFNTFGRRIVNVVVSRSGSFSKTEAFVFLETDSGGASIASWNNLLFVGAPNSDNSEGRVDIYSRDSDGWSFEQTIKASNAGIGDEFGASIAVYGNQLVVTAPGEDGGFSGIFNGLAVDSGFSSNVNDNSGAVYVYTSEGPNWTETAYIKKPLNTIGANGYEHGFGSDIAIYADRLIVGASKDSSYFDSVAFVETGRADLYRLNDSSDWELETPLETSIKREGNHFGASVALYQNRVAVGAPGDSSGFRGVVSDPAEIGEIDTTNPDFDPTEQNSGAVYLFENTGSVWVKSAYLKADNADAGDGFGEAVSLADNKLLVGAPLEDGSGADLNRDIFSNGLDGSGAAYYYQPSAIEDSALGSWNLQAYFKSTNPRIGANFGAELDIDNNWFAIAEPKSAAFDGQGLGQVSLYNNNLEQVLSASSPDDNTQTVQELFGASLAIGKDSLFIGAPGFVVDDENGEFIIGAGAFSVYE